MIGTGPLLTWIQKLAANIHTYFPSTASTVIGFFVLNPILSDLAILCKFGLCNLEKKVTPSGNRTQASHSL